MADTEIGGATLTQITSPASTDRLVLSTGSASGGYTPRGGFVWKTAAGNFEAQTSAGKLSIAPYGSVSAKLLSSGGLGYDVGAASAHSFQFGGTALGTFINSTGTNACAFGLGMAGNPQSFANYVHLQLGDTTAGPSGGAQLTLYGNASAMRGYLEASATGFRVATSTADHIIFRTNATDRMLIQSDGHVRPNGNNTQTFGTSLNRWSEVWASKVVTPTGVSLALQGGAGGQWNISAGTGAFFPSTDNALPIGGGANRASVVYAGTGTINTSDGREKTPLRAFTEAELRAAKRIGSAIGVYRFLAGSREHVGVIAQDVWAIMADEGLVEPIVEGVKPHSSYAFLCHDEWDAVEAVAEVRDDEGNIITEAVAPREAGDRFGVRPDQLAMFLLAAQEARLAALEAAGD